MSVPNWKAVPDHFVWLSFEELSNDNRSRLEPDAFQQEALLAQTTNFYVIPDQFGVVNGHLLVLPKKPATSMAALDPSLDDEVTWLLERTSKVVAEAYEAQVVVAEHGECGCATNNQAHVHLLPVPATVMREHLSPVIDLVFERRMVGIERIVYRDVEFTDPEDLRALLERDGATVFGRRLNSCDLTMPGMYPAAARQVTGLVLPYVYFRGPGLEFVTTYSLGSQFVREVVARVTDLPAGSWDRRSHPDRTRMFETYETLAPAFAGSPQGEYGFHPRSRRHERVTKGHRPPRKSVSAEVEHHRPKVSTGGNHPRPSGAPRGCRG